MFDAAGQRLQQAGHRSPSFQCTICCSMERALNATRSMLRDAVSFIHIEWHKNYSLVYLRRPDYAAPLLLLSLKMIITALCGSARICAPSLQLCW